MKTFTTKIAFLLLVGLFSYSTSLLGQIKKDAQKQPAKVSTKEGTLKQPARVYLKTSRGTSLRGNVISLKGDTLVVEDQNNEMVFFSVKSLQTVRFYDSNGEVLTRVANKSTPQANDNEVAIETLTGDKLRGKLLSRRGDTIELDMGLDKPLLINVSQLKSIQQATTTTNDNDTVFVTESEAEQADPQAPFENPFASRGVLTHSGMPMKKGESYYQNIDGVVFHNFGFYLSDNINMQIGVLGLPVAGFANVNTTFPISNYFVAGGGVVFWVFPENFASTVFGTFAVGNRDHNVGVRLGKHLSKGEFDNDGLAFSIAGQTRFTNNWSFAAELLAFAPKEEINILTIGARYIRPRFALDFGLAGAGEIQKNAFSSSRDFAFGLPYVTATFLMGKKPKK